MEGISDNKNQKDILIYLLLFITSLLLICVFIYGFMLFLVCLLLTSLLLVLGYKKHKTTIQKYKNYFIKLHEIVLHDMREENNE